VAFGKLYMLLTVSAADSHSSVGLQSHVAMVFADGWWYADDNPRTFV
jgi:hypothetical protein